jgi:hypothetical protein
MTAIEIPNWPLPTLDQISFKKILFNWIISILIMRKSSDTVIGRADYLYLDL